MPNRRELGYVSSGNTPSIVGQVGAYGVATGGTSSSITDSVTYTLLTFTSDGSLVVSTPGLFDVCLVGGGAGGAATGGNWGVGGGGGGGGVFRTTVYLNATTYAVTVGGGGAGAGESNRGSPSSINVTSTLSSVGGLVAFGGGPTGITTNLAAQFMTGATGGGAGQRSSATPGFGTDGQGYNGGARNTTGTYTGGGGGGGGAGAVGGNASGNTGGNGGAGKDISTFLGQSAGTTYKGGGGAGGGSGADGTAGSGNGAVNSGGGGKGNTNNTAATSANNGYSGVVYVRFKV